MITRVCSPYGEHLVVIGANAPDDETEEHIYQTMNVIRAFDVDPSYMAESAPYDWQFGDLTRLSRRVKRDPEYEPPTN